MAGPRQVLRAPSTGGHHEDTQPAPAALCVEGQVGTGASLYVCLLLESVGRKEQPLCPLAVQGHSCLMQVVLAAAQGSVTVGTRI